MNDALDWILKAGGPGAVCLLGWWLSNKFRDMETGFNAAITRHEEVDQKRHVENIERFSDINVTLARNGLNGGPRRHEPHAS